MVNWTYENGYQSNTLGVYRIDYDYPLRMIGASGYGQMSFGASYMHMKKNKSVCYDYMQPPEVLLLGNNIYYLS